MKNYLFLGMMSAVVFFNSCSSNDDNATINNPSNPQVLLSKVTTVYYTNPASPNTSIQTFDYNNQRQLIQILSQDRTTRFEYDNAGKLSKTTYYKADGTIAYYTICIYNGNQLTEVKAVYSNPDANTTRTYTYNNDKVYGTSFCSSSNCTIPSTSSYTYTNDNISTEISFSDHIDGQSTIKKELSYDNKINPYTLINKSLRMSIINTQFLSQNNYTSEKLSKKDSAGNWDEILNINYEIQYNASQLPSQVLGRTNNGNAYIQYNYEYTTQ